MKIQNIFQRKTKASKIGSYLSLLAVALMALTISCSDKTGSADDPDNPQNPSSEVTFYIHYPVLDQTGTWASTREEELNFENGVDINPQKPEISIISHVGGETIYYPFHIEYDKNLIPWLRYTYSDVVNSLYINAASCSFDTPLKAFGVFLIDGKEKRFEIRLPQMDDNDNLIPILGQDLSKNLIREGHGNESKIVRNDLLDVDNLNSSVPSFAILNLFPSLRHCSASCFNEISETIVVRHPKIERMSLDADTADVIIDCPQLEELDINASVKSYIGNHPKIKSIALSLVDGTAPKSVDFGNCPELIELYFWKSTFTDFDITRFPALVNFRIYNSPNLKSLDLSQMDSLRDFAVINSGLEDIKLHKRLIDCRIELDNNKLRKLEIPLQIEDETYSNNGIHLYLKGNPGENGIFPVYVNDEKLDVHIYDNPWEYEGQIVTAQLLKKNYRAPEAIITAEEYFSDGKWRKVSYKLEYSDFGSPKQDKYIIYAATTPNAGPNSYIWKREGSGNVSNNFYVENDKAARIYVCAELKCELGENRTVRTNEVAVELAPVQEPGGRVSDISAKHNSATMQFNIESNPKISNITYFCTEYENNDTGIDAKSWYNGVLNFSGLTPETRYYVRAIGQWREKPFALTLGEFTTGPEPEQTFQVTLNSISTLASTFNYVGPGLAKYETKFKVSASYTPYISDVEMYFETPLGDYPATSVSGSSFYLFHTFEWYKSHGQTDPTWEIRAYIVYKGKKHYSSWGTLKP